METPFLPGPAKTSILSRHRRARYVVQSGGFPFLAEPLHGELRGLLELRVHDRDVTYRAVYRVRFRGFVYVLHVFLKKSTYGIATSRRDAALILARSKQAELNHAGNKPTGEHTR
ncbi:MAG: type II toxin-antitoxin system RelE/ParE family toxin [Gemmatimonadetes bacterium]|nr:type II toxin-antitoxin system RelE/ParE family toxin [Gemmatimonadota bacterium]